MDDLIRILTFRAGHNTAVVLAGATLLGVAAGVIGTFAVLRKRALMSDALAHATLPGIGVAFIAAAALGGQGRSLPVLLLGAAVSGVLGILAVQGIVRFSRVREDAAIGIVLSVFFGVGIVLLSYIQTMATGAEGGLHHFIYGQAAAMSRGDAILMGSLAAVAVAGAALLHKEFGLVAFDEGFAAAQGWPVGRIDLLMMALVTLVVVVGLQAVGLLLVVAMLIIPPAAARFWTERLGLMLAIAGAVGGLSGYLGTAASAAGPALWPERLPALPTGAVIVLTAGVLFLGSLTLAPTRGVAAAAVRRGRLRASIARQHLLRAVLEAEEAGVAPVPLHDLARTRRWSGLALRVLAMWLSARGSLARRGGAVSLTERGRREAVRITRNHRLWEQFLVLHADRAASHVDRSADLVEHVLSAEMVAELEDVLRREGRMPGETIESVHPLRAGGAAGERAR